MLLTLLSLLAIPAFAQENLETPIISSVESIPEGVNITWNAVDGASRYRVFKRTENSNWLRVGDTSKTMLLDGKDVKPNCSYCYTVRCINEDGTEYTSLYDVNGKIVETISETNTPQTLDAPKLLSAEGIKEGNKVSWEPVEGVEVYRLFRKMADTSWKKVTDTDKLSFTDTKYLKPGTEYIYTVRGMNKDTTEYVSFFDSAGISVKTYPYECNTPQVKTAISTENGIKLTWDSVDKAKLYRVYRKEGSEWKRLTTTNKTTFTDTKNLKANTEYIYTLRCVSSDQQEFTSDYNADGFRYKWIPMAKITEISNLDYGQRIKWNNVNGAEYYIFYVKKQGETYNRVTVTNKTYCDYNKTKDGTKYIYTVIPSTKDGKKLNEDYEGKSYTFHTFPTISKISNEGEKQKISFSKVSGVKYYRVYVKGSNGWNRITTTTDNYAYNNNVKNKTSYEYTVRGVDADGNFVTSFNSFKSLKYTAPPSSVNEFLIDLPSSRTDTSYRGKIYNLSSAERSLIENIVEGEFGGDYKGAVMVAQCIRDAITYGYSSIMGLPYEMGYYGYSAYGRNISSTTEKAVSYVFDKGGSAFQHRALVMYNSSICSSYWHESQYFVYQHSGYWGNVRFFDM